MDLELWSDGKKYLGSYENDLRNGFGIFLWKKNLKFYVGFWKQGKQNGFGKIIKSHGESYGFFKDSKRIRRYSKDEFFEEIQKRNDKKLNRYLNFFYVDMEKAISLLE